MTLTSSGSIVSTRPMSYASSPQNPPASKLAVWSLILGILSLGCGFVAGIPAVICGHMGLSRVGRSGGALSGQGLAVAGLITGYTGLVVGSIMIAAIVASMALPIFNKVRTRANLVTQEFQLQVIYGACMEYASENNGVLPVTLETLVEEGYLAEEELDVAQDGEPDYVIRVTGRLDDLDPSETLLESVPDTPDQREIVRLRVDGVSVRADPSGVEW